MTGTSHAVEDRAPDDAVAAPHSLSPEEPSRRRLVAPWTPVRLAVAVALALVALLTVLGVYAAIAGALSPAWWTDASTAALTPESADLAERLERGVANELHRWRDEGERWTVALTSEQANAWLAHRLPKWLANSDQWRGDAPLILVRFQDGRATLGARGEWSERVVAVAIRPRVDESQALWTRAMRVSVGRLGLPDSLVHRRANEILSRWPDSRETARRVLSALAGRVPLLDRAEVELEDGRTVRVVDLKVENGRILATCESGRAGARPPG